METYKLKVACDNCKSEFIIEMKRGVKFGEKRNLVCSNCGAEEYSQYGWYSYNYHNFRNLGLVKDEPPEEVK